MVAAPPLILASASPRRLALLAQIGVVPTMVLPAEIDETPQPLELPAAYARRMAGEKARTVAQLQPGGIVLAADTVVTCGRRILPKAEEEASARHCLRLLSGRRHRVLSAVAVIDVTGRLRERLTLSTVSFKRLNEAEISSYLASGEWRGKAGGYAIQGRAAALIQALSGSYSGVVGLPLYETRLLLGAAGFG